MGEYKTMTAQEYLKDHSINEESVSNFGITFDENWLNIPIKDESGHQLFIKSRNLSGGDPKYKNSAGSHATLFNLHAVKDSPNIVLCEGEIDCIRLIQGGIPSVSSTGGAGTFLPEWAKYFEGKNVWIIFDNDTAGREGTRKVLTHIPQARVVSLPEGVKDVCEFYKQHDQGELANLMRIAQTKLEWEASNLPEEFSLETIKDIASQEFPEQNWIIKDIVYAEGFCFLYGGEGTGKSFLALDIAKAAATGTPWLDKFEVPNKTNVLILDKENPKSMISRRAKGLSMGDIDNIHYLKYPEKFALSDGKGELSTFAQALSTIVQKEEIGLIIIDSFVDLMVGNESSSGDTQVFFNALRQLFPNVAFLVLHHENKPSQGVFRSDSQRLRGSSNINAQTFTMFRLEPVAKSKTEMTIKQTKARDSQKLDKFMVRMIVIDLPEGGTAVSGFEYMGEVEEAVDDTKNNDVKELVNEMIATKKFVSQQDILDVASGRGISAKTARRAIKEMLEEGYINEVKKGREKWYTAGMFVPENEENSEDYDRDDVLSQLDGGLPL